MNKNYSISPSDRLYNSRITATYVKFLRKEYGHVDIGDILSYAGMETYQVEDEAHWFTQEQVDLFNERVVKATGKTDIAREAGRFGFSIDSLGFVKSYVLGCMSIGKGFEMITQITSKFVKSCSWQSAKLASNRVKVVVTPRPGAREKPYQCQNRIGYFEAGAALFHHKFPQIEHSKCIHKGDDCCEFVVTWREFRYEVWKKVRNLGAALLFAAIGIGFLWEHHVGLVGALSGLVAWLLFSSYVWKLERKELHEGISNLSRSTEEVVGKMETSIKNMDFARQVIVALSTETDREGMIKQITSIFEKELEYDRGMILLANKEKTNLVFYGGFGYGSEYLPILQNMNPRLRPESTGIFTVCFRERKPFLINDVDKVTARLSPRTREFIRHTGAKSFVCVPIVSSNETLGVLALDNVITKRPLLQSDLDLLVRIAPEIGMAIQNAMAAEDKERQFHSILGALASSIDARDPLTAGHSERVTRFAVGIAREMGLPQATIEMIRVSALLHDYGKIGIADAILKKPGKLTNAEYDEIKTHAAKTKQILDKIEFQGIYRDVPKVASSHHEKFDGTGYPGGLKGADIPLGARILAVADVFEAVTARRHYRSAMRLSEAFELLQKDRGKHFDPDVLDAFISFYEREGGAVDASLQAASQPETDGPQTEHRPLEAGRGVPEKQFKRGAVVMSLNQRRT
jgi:HD-GYP domain-containing protein (c-di-GMP phosphodiesterase class II)/predicted hydrocarbon binding protein